MNIESPSPWILSKSTQIESGPDSAEFVGSVGWYRSWWAWASLGFRGTTWASGATTFTDFTVTCWVFGVLAEGRMGMQRESERNLFASWDVQRSVTSRVTGARPWPCCTTCFPLWSFLRWSRQSDVYACLRMSTLWIWSNIGSKRLWQIDEMMKLMKWIHGFMDSWG